MSSNRLQQQKRARKQLAKAFEHTATTLMIHYSCESFYDRKEASSPRITSIAVRHLDSAQAHSFSIHLVAECKGVPFEKIEDSYDELERQMLEEFFRFVGQGKKHTWLHWNMRDANYGFPAIEHRSQVLGGRPETIPDDFKVDLARVLRDIFGPNYAPHGDSGRLMSLAKINDLTIRDALSGAKEAEAFQQKDYVALHQSTLRKVDILANLATRAFEGTLKTNAGWWEINGGTPRAIVEYLKDHPWVWMSVGLVGLVAAIITIVQSCADG